MTAAGEKRRWTSRIGSIIRRTSKSHRVTHSISFDKDAEFVPRNGDDDSGLKTSSPRITTGTLDIQPMLSTLCTIAESPLREAEATQSAASPCLGGIIYEVNTPTSSHRAVIDSPEPPIIRIGEVFIIPDPIYEEPQAGEPPKLDVAESTKDRDQDQVPRTESTDGTSTASFYEMTHCSSIQHMSLSQLPLDPGRIDTYLPLTQNNTLETPTTTTHSSDDDVISWYPYATSSDKLEKLHTMGWSEYHFPNGKLYYFHLERKVSTEVDLTNDTFLNMVEDFWEEQAMNVGSWSILRRNSKLGVTLNGFVEDEIWLKDIRLSNEGSEPMFEMWWVDHVARTMVLVSQEIDNGGAATIQEDQIDMEHRYWAFIQSHPAHTVLPPNAKSAAINTLAWAWTDHLLSLDHYDSIPFTEEECRDMMTLLQSLAVEKRHHQMIQTSIVASIFLQVAQWHKSRRTDKASPTDIRTPILESSNHQLPDSQELKKSRVSRRFFIDLLIFILILLFIFLYVLGQGSLMFIQVQIIVDEIVGRASASLPSLDWTRSPQSMGWSRLKGVGI